MRDREIDSVISTASNAGLKGNGNKKKTFKWEEVKMHTTPDDAWLVYNNKVYDVSNWTEHPGGAVIFTHAGDDMVS